jgi:nucleotide-binding universal stress UspA family protein
VLSAGLSPLLCVPLPEDRAAEEIPSVRSVLVPTDFSDLGNRAARQAYAFLRASGGTIVLCHVQPPSAGAQKLAEDRLRKLVPAAADIYDLRTKFLVLEGTDIAQTLAEAADELAVDAVCMGSRGLSALEPHRLGSVAAGVLRLSKRPVFILRQ